jgi:hypothetical protein
MLRNPLRSGTSDGFDNCSKSKSKRVSTKNEAPPVAAAMGGVFFHFLVGVDTCLDISVTV